MHGVWTDEEDEQSKAMIFGTGSHTALLEPERFDTGAITTDATIVTIIAASDKTRIVSLPVCREIGYPFRLYLCTASIIRRCAEMQVE